MKSITITELDEINIKENAEKGIATIFLYKNDMRYIYQIKKEQVDLGEQVFEDMIYFYSCLGKPDWIVHHIVIDDIIYSLRITRKSITYYNDGSPIKKTKNNVKQIYGTFDKIESMFENIDIADFRKKNGNNVVGDKFKIFF